MNAVNQINPAGNGLALMPRSHHVKNAAIAGLGITKGITMKILTGYHFTGETLRNGDQIPAIGVWLKYEGDIVPCQSGLHASEHPFDALQYAPGNLLHKVELRGNLQSHGQTIDKWVGRERKIIASLNVEKLLRDFARWNALNFIHLWEAPAVVKQYLETGDEIIRAAAWDAARDAARAAAWDAAWDAARAAAWDAARDAARAAARDAARAAAWAAARAAAWDAARAAARAAAWDAAWAAAWDAAWDADIQKTRAKFQEMIEQAFNQK